MASTDSLRHLTTVQGSFHGRVLAARLGAEGIVVELRGMSEGPYPLQGAVEVFVCEAQLDLAREILLADAVDAAVDAESVELQYSSMQPQGDDTPQEDDSVGIRRIDRIGVMIALLIVVALVVVGLVSLTA